MRTIPVALFTYARPHHLKRTLECLRVDRVPLIYAFSDGPGNPDMERAVDEVRGVLRGIDWAEVVLHEQRENLGLGTSIREGVSRVLSRHDSLLVFEDDLICVPGTYAYLSAALRHYSEASSVMSVTGWTHPRVTPSDVSTSPYFDGRAECWVWGAWRRSWQGMEEDPLSLMRECCRLGINVRQYGDDLPRMAQEEASRNIWAVRFLYLHMLRRGLCLRPPWSMVEHTGFDDSATNANDGSEWKSPPLRECPPLPEQWPSPTEHRECAQLWQTAYGSRPFLDRAGRKIGRVLSELMFPKNC